MGVAALFKLVFLLIKEQNMTTETYRQYTKSYKQLST